MIFMVLAINFKKKDIFNLYDFLYNVTIIEGASV